MRAVNPGIWLRSRINVAEATPQRSIEPQLSLVPDHQPSHGARRWFADNWLLVAAILCFSLFAVTFFAQVLDPTVATLAGDSAEAWSQSSP